MYSDFLLIRQMKQGEEPAFDFFVRKYYPEILTYCYHHCPDKAYAEDMTQETFLRFFAKLPDYSYWGKTKNYLYTIAGNLCKDYFKKRKDLPVEDPASDTLAVSAEHPMEEVLNRLTVAWAIQQLPTELSEVVILHYFQELKLTEIAATLHISLPLVKYRLKQAKTQLRKQLEKEGFHEPGKKPSGL